MTEARFPINRLEGFAAAILRGFGVPDDHAAITAQRLVEADARGRTGHGLIRLGPYVDRIEAGGLNLSPNIRALHETPVSALIDGDNGLGQVVMTRATELAIAKAETTGLAWVGTVHSNHAGAAGIYPAMAADRGLIGMYLAVANANGMPPWGGSERVLGTNPIAFAIPAGETDRFELDIATTVASHGTIKVVAQAGEQMPEGWVIDAAGNPITDPKRAHEGSLMPIGGYKGAGLNIAIGLLAGVLNGSAFGKSVIDHRVQMDIPTNTGQAILVMRLDLFMARDEIEAAMHTKLEELRNTGAAGSRIQLPGERAAARIADSTKNGVPLPEPLRLQLNELAGRAGMTETLS